MRRWISVFALVSVTASVIFSVCRADNELPLLRAPLGVRIETLDPTEAEDFATIRVLMNLGMGLTRYSKDLTALPGLAKSWSISADGKVYRFILNQNHWSDGRPLEITDFIRGFEHTCSPKTIAKLATPFLEVVKGAAEYKSGKLTDFQKVGIKIIDQKIGEKTLEFTLTHRAPYFLNLLALPYAFPQREKFQISPRDATSGPYVLQSKNPSGLKLEPNIFSSVKAHNVLLLKVVPESSTALSLYEKKELDLTERVPSQDFKRFAKSPALVKAPFLATYYVGFNISKSPSSDIHFRRALALSLNRQELGKILQDPQRPASSWVPAPLEGSEKSFGPLYDPIAGKKEWSEFLKTHPDFKNLELIFDAQEKNTLVASWVQQELLKNLNLKIELRSMEWKTYLKELNQKPVFFRFAWLAAFPDALSHLGVFKSDNPNNYTGFANEKYDELVMKIAKTERGAKRLEMINRAQDILLGEEVAIIPLYHYIQYYLIRPDWQGLDVTPMGLIYYYPAAQKRGP